MEEFDVKIPQTIAPILQTFLSKVGATSGWNDINVRNKIMIPAIKFIFDKLKNNKEDTVSSIATSLGDCSMPVNYYIQQQFVDMQAQKDEQLRRCDL